MARVLLDMAVSLDGLVSGPGGTDVGLYDWFFDPPEASRPVVEAMVADTGAILVGRTAYGTADDAQGWDETPYDVPHVVVTHRPPDPLPAGPVRFEFVAGVPAAVARSAELAGERWVAVGGGADVARQCLAAGLVDEVQLHVVPIVVGDGLPLFTRPSRALRLTPVRVVSAPSVTHCRYRVEPG
ncbi:Dihydrofolate reductase [Geodermatophilus amargosae]|uniref:Dihydrofolate reductase n=1 Tax=Geodermatophilus amargosae TaxID=1296565 RepID=A0A1I6YLN3_9ACTN|nr:dihydrofolate reductase family protein [Geodermatophilus amargosae]SFT51376.1 Dihydrofolate reductase [Geodermatophilus amargosae]